PRRNYTDASHRSSKGHSSHPRGLSQRREPLRGRHRGRHGPSRLDRRRFIVAASRANAARLLADCSRAVILFDWSLREDGKTKTDATTSEFNHRSDIQPRTNLVTHYEQNARLSNSALAASFADDQRPDLWPKHRVHLPRPVYGQWGSPGWQ